MRNQKTKIMVEAALLVALAVVLNFVGFKIWPNGGSITAAAMAPMVILSLRHGWKWGILGAFTFSLLQMLMDGISPPPVQSLFWFAMVILLDYVIAYTVLGLASLFQFGKSKFAPAIASVCVTMLRYLCHIISGVAIWGVYAPEGTQPIVYSTLYNGSYMIPETIITAFAVMVLMTVLNKSDTKTTV